MKWYVILQLASNRIRLMTNDGMLNYKQFGYSILGPFETKSEAEWDLLAS